VLDWRRVSEIRRASTNLRCRYLRAVQTSGASTNLRRSAVQWRSGSNSASNSNSELRNLKLRGRNPVGTRAKSSGSHCDCQVRNITENPRSTGSGTGRRKCRFREETRGRSRGDLTRGTTTPGARIRRADTVCDIMVEVLVARANTVGGIVVRIASEPHTELPFVRRGLSAFRLRAQENRFNKIAAETVSFRIRQLQWAISVILCEGRIIHHE